PAIAAADHASGQDRQQTMRSPPGCNGASERGFEVLVRDELDSVLRLDAVADVSGRIDEVRAKARGAPIEDDVFGRRRAGGHRRMMMISLATDSKRTARKEFDACREALRFAP